MSRRLHLAFLATALAVVAGLPAVARGDDVTPVETATVADAVTIVPPVSITVAEGIHASDGVTVTPPVVIAVAENASASDAVVVVPPLSLGVAESVTAQDAESVVPPATIGVDEHAQATDSVDAAVVNTKPKLASIADGAAKEGAQFAAAGSFVDPDFQTWTATIDWGDAGQPQPLALKLDKTFALAHVYDDNGTFTATVVLTDAAGASDTTTFHVAVANVAPTAELANGGPVPEGSPVTIAVGKAFDPSRADTAAGFTFAFDCGKGYGQPGPSPTSSCTFDDDGTYAVKATIADKDGGATELTTSVAVTNVAPTAKLANGGPVGEGSPVAIAFTDASDPSPADTAAGFRYRFDCGDGFGAAGSDPSTTCTFPDNGTYTVAGRILDDDGGASDYTTTVEVTNVAPTFDLVVDPAAVDEGTPVTVYAANETDVSPRDAEAGFEYQFDCGDGYGPRGAAKSRACTWDDGPSSHTVRARIFDKDGGSIEHAAAVAVRNVAPAVQLSAPAHVDEGSTFALAATATDVSAADTAAGFAYAFDCGDGAGFGAFGAAASATCATTDNGTRDVGVRARDKDGGVSETRATVSVDGVAPTATLVAPTAPVTEGSTFTVALVSATDPSAADTAAGFRYRFDCGGGYGASSPVATATCTAVDDPAATVRAAIADKDGAERDYTASVPVANAAPTVTITAPASGAGFRAGTPVSLAASFSDPGVLDTHTAAWSLDGVTTPGLVTELGGTGTATLTTVFPRAGVYTVTAAVTDNAGAVGRATIVVGVFDPNAGFVTAAGWQQSSYGKAHFEVSGKYGNGVLAGEATWWAGTLSFTATSLDWLAVTGNAAELRGTGTLGAATGRAFEIFVVDGRPDGFRIKIWDPATGAVAFDSLPGAPDDLDLFTPPPLGAGNVAVH